MPIPVDEVQKYKGLAKTSINILRFLQSNKTHAQSFSDIWDGIGWKREKGFLKFFLGAWALQSELDKLVKKGKIKANEVDFEKYYYLA